ncbi:glycosyltransferase family 2 protein [Moorena sp. SIO4G3]|uniref:glycosyltransferase family 2 protein n=1 Tax=Moorena sp. SIO4G3 TaxID=2607821 RepID=UPI00142B6D97|nr:glycosyltransferase family 2 protein [Moorena sp. SIO4G3]NEO78321.1 glycosyltransferase family 2 protein [Moorena sp. SIO4G3]
MSVVKTVDSLPLVSVIIPAYNTEQFIEITLQSVLSQTYKNMEVIVVDDGSQDRTAEIVQSIAKQDQRVILLQQPNLGVAAARNLGIKNAKGDYIAPLDADDIWYPQNLEKQVKRFLATERSVGLVYAWSADIDAENSLTGDFRASTIEGKVYKTLVCHNFLGNASASVIRASCFETVGGYNCQLKAQQAQGCEDWELYLRISEHYEFAVVPEFMIGYRKIVSSMSRDYSQMAKSHGLMLRDVQQRHPEIPAALYRLSKSSFYMYLARQSSQCSSDRSTLFWLSQALKADFITPIFRYGLYILFIKSVFRMITKLKSDNYVNKPGLSVSYADLTKRRGSLYFKLLLGNLLHRSLLMI